MPRHTAGEKLKTCFFLRLFGCECEHTCTSFSFKNIEESPLCAVDAVPKAQPLKSPLPIGTICFNVEHCKLPEHTLGFMWAALCLEVGLCTRGAYKTLHGDLHQLPKF